MRYTSALASCIVALLTVLVPSVSSYLVNKGTTCELYPEHLTHHGLAVDDTPYIQQAFDICGTNGTIIFSNHTFFVDQVLNTTNLLNTYVDIKGTLKYSDNVPYWKKNSYNVVYQNQVTTWLIGGKNLTIKGGTYDGNGQTWYTGNRNNSNEPYRPIAMTFTDSEDLYVSDLSFVKPQFWSIFVIWSHNVTFERIFINATSDDEWYTMNCDGADTWNAYDVTFRDWYVANGDDCVAIKGNSSNILMQNIECHKGTGMTIGSVGQYPETPDYVQNITFENMKMVNAMDGAYIKTWQGQNDDSTSNGDAGGGGLGFVKNVTFRNFEMVNVALPIQITQCVYSEEGSNFCDTSKMHISDIHFENITGTSEYNIAASLHCSGETPCDDIFFKDVHIKAINQTLDQPFWNTSIQEEIVQCGYINNQNTTSNIPCNRWAPNNFAQWVYSNVA